MSEILVSHPVQTERAHIFIRLQRRAAEQLAEPPLPQASLTFHLPQSMLGMQVSQREECVRIGLRKDMRYALLIRNDPDGIAEPREPKEPLLWRQALAQIEETGQQHQAD